MKIYNTMSKKKEEFIPLEEGKEKLKEENENLKAQPKTKKAGA